MQAGLTPGEFGGEKESTKTAGVKKPAAHQPKCSKTVTWAKPIAKGSSCQSDDEEEAEEEAGDEEEAEEELEINKSFSSKRTVPDDEPREARRKCKRLMQKTAVAPKPARKNKDEKKPANGEDDEPDSSSRYDHALEKKEKSVAMPSKRLPETPKAMPTKRMTAPKSRFYEQKAAEAKLQDKTTDESSADETAQAACTPAVPNAAATQPSNWDGTGGSSEDWQRGFHVGDESEDSMDRGPGDAFGV